MIRVLALILLASCATAAPSDPLLPASTPSIDLLLPDLGPLFPPRDLAYDWGGGPSCQTCPPATAPGGHPTR